MIVSSAKLFSPATGCHAPAARVHSQFIFSSSAIPRQRFFWRFYSSHWHRLDQLSQRVCNFPELN